MQNVQETKLIHASKHARTMAGKEDGLVGPKRVHVLESSNSNKEHLPLVIVSKLEVVPINSSTWV